MSRPPVPEEFDPYDGADALTMGANRVQTSMDRDASAGGLTTGRIQSLSDGIFGVAMTLMVLNLVVPQAGASASSENDLIGRLASLWSAFAVYALSFVIAGFYWVGQHSQFHYIQVSDRSLLWINLVFLMTIVLIPFSTTLVARYPRDPLAALIYGANLAGTGILLAVSWRHAVRGHLLFPGVDQHTTELVGSRSSLGNRIVSLGMAAALAGVVLDAVVPGLFAVGSVLGWVGLGVYAIVPIVFVRPSHLDDHLKQPPDRSHE
ncbi:MAG: TMEM175 family protein [Thermoplasmata archaeon]|nr:TMEM175 family protein [Thermoplasmata archaeon]